MQRKNHRLGKPINDTPKPLRSVRANGDKLKSLRVTAGLTQEELAGNVGYSDRLIRKAKMGKRVDLKTIRALHQYFVELDQPFEMSELVIAEPPLADQILPAKWFDYFYEQQDLTSAVRLLSENCIICFDGVSISPDRMLRLMSSLTSKYLYLEFGIEYQASRGAWHVLGWRCDRQMSGADDEVGIAETTTISGVTSFRMKHQQIVELREFTDTPLYCSGHHQLLLSYGEKPFSASLGQPKKRGD